MDESERSKCFFLTCISHRAFHHKQKKKENSGVGPHEWRRGRSSINRILNRKCIRMHPEVFVIRSSSTRFPHPPTQSGQRSFEQAKSLEKEGREECEWQSAQVQLPLEVGV